MLLKKLWKPKGSRMSSLLSITFFDEVIKLNVKMNDTVDVSDYYNLLFLLKNRTTQEEILINPDEAVASNTEISIQYTIDKSVFGQVGLWDAYILNNESDNKYRVYDGLTAKMEMRSSSIKELGRNIILYSTVKGNLSIRVTSLEPFYMLKKIHINENGALLIRGVAGGIDIKDLEEVEGVSFILESKDHQVLEKSLDLIRANGQIFFEKEINLRDVLSLFKSSKLSVYIKTRYKGEEYTSSLYIKNKSVLPKDSIFINHHSISFHSVNRKTEMTFELYIKNIESHYELNEVYFKDENLTINGEVLNKSIGEEVSSVLFRNRSDFSVVKIPIKTNIIKINLANLLKDAELGLGIWDIYIETNYNSYRVSKVLDDIEHKQKIVQLPQYTMENSLNELFSVKPYYTLNNDLSLLIRKVAAQKKIQHYRIEKDSFILNGLLNVNPSNGEMAKTLTGEFSSVIYFRIPNKTEKITVPGTINLEKTSNTILEYSFEFISSFLNRDVLNDLIRDINFDLAILKVHIDDNKFISLQLNIDAQKGVFSFEDRAKLNNNIINRLLFKNYNVVYRIFNKSLPINNKIIVFQSFHGKSYSCNPRAIYEELVRTRGQQYKYVWVLNNINKKLTENSNTVIVKPNSLKYFYYMAKAKYFVNNGNFPDFYRKRKGTVHIQTWHGTPLKKLGYDISPNSPSYKENTSPALIRRNSRWDFTVSPNTFTSSVYRSAFAFKKDILETGYPRNDIFYVSNKEKIANSVKEELGIPRNKKVILYAPTWRDDDFHNKKQHEPFQFKFNLDHFIEKFGEEYVLLVRLHYRDAVRAQISKYEGLIYNVSNYDDIKYLYLITDILVTDYSSVMFDFANSGKPIIFFAYDINKYSSALRGFYFNFRKEAPGPIVTNEVDLFKSINNIKQISFLYKNLYKDFYNKYCEFDDGLASKKIIDRIF